LKASDYMRRSGLRSAKLQITNHKSQIRQRGYMLITLMLAFALIAIALLTVLPEIGQQIQRDREEELRHRGTAYMRALQHFYKKFGRYPSRIEELENTNNLRFLRKRYKDPINRDPATGKEKDFKLLHQTDISLNNGPVLGQTPGQSPFGGAGGVGGMQGGAGGLGAQSGGLQPATVTSGSSSPSDDAEGNSSSPGSSSSNSNTSSSSGFSGPTFGGGPILGVASTSKAKSIRVFFDKSHYDDWLFIYVPQADRGGLLTGPVNPGMPGGPTLGAIPPGVGGGLTQQGPGLSPNVGQPQNTPVQPPQTPPEQ
jgi:type II secretory pathway pseudopilin PulG